MTPGLQPGAAPGGSVGPSLPVAEGALRWEVRGEEQGQGLGRVSRPEALPLLSEPICAIGHGVAALCCATSEDRPWVFRGYSVTGVSAVRGRVPSHRQASETRVRAWRHGDCLLWQG